MQFFLSFSLLAGFFFTLFLGLFVLSKKKSAQNIIFALMCFCISVWLFGTFEIIINAGNKEKIIFWDRVVYLGVVFIPALVYSFYVVFIKKINKTLILLNFGLSLFFLILSQTNFFAEDVYTYSWGGHLNGKFPHDIYVFWFAASSALFFYNFLKYYRVTKMALERGQVRYILLSFAFLAIGGIMGFLPAYGIDILPLGHFFVMLFASTFAYAIVKYRLMGIRTIVSNIYIYTLIAAFAYSFFFSVLLIDEVFFGGPYSSKALFISPILSFVFSISFVPFFKKVQKSSDVLFFRGNNPREILKDLAFELSSVIALKQLLNTLTAEFKKIIASDIVDVYLIKKEKDKDVLVSILKNERKRISPNNTIFKAVMKERRVIVRDEKEKGDQFAIVKEMDKLGAKVIAPLILRHKLIGIIFLGEKLTGDEYSQEDIEFLEIISNQAAVAIENAHLYDEIENFNETLQQKVDEQTKELKEKAEHLRKLMDMRSEFLDITSHQLRTPVTVIKGVLSMLEEGSIPQAKMTEFIRGALDKSIKLGEIINDILRASEMDTDKFTMTLGPVDLNEMLEKIKDDKIRTAQIKNVEFIVKLPKNPLPQVVSNAKYIEQAILNLVNNSFQYTLKGSVTLTAEVTGKSVIIRVIDTGIGIPKEQVGKLFQKFSRAENARATYTDGSGLGLFIIRQVVDANPGANIEIEKTEENVGTTFALTLPIVNDDVLKQAEILNKQNAKQFQPSNAVAALTK